MTMKAFFIISLQFAINLHFKIKKYFRILCTSVLCLNVCLYTTFVPDALEGQKWVSGDTALNLHMVMECHVSGGN